jgi:hypothetical protein
MSCVDPLDWFTEKCDWSALKETPSDTRADYRVVLRDMNVGSPFTQTPVKIVEV